MSVTTSDAPLYQQHVARHATNVDFYVNAARREHVQAAVGYLIEHGDRAAAQEVMANCLARQARVSGIRLGAATEKEQP